MSKGHLPQTRTHRERAQPSSRSKFGLLEKHTDYVARARSYASKRLRLKSLAIKASSRNPDEFYFGMINSRIDPKTGKHLMGEDKSKRNKEGGVLDADVAKILKTQDRVYLEMLRSVNRAKLDNTKHLKHSIKNTNNSNQHTRFVDDTQEGLELLASIPTATVLKPCTKQLDDDPERIIRQERVRKLDVAIRALDVQRSALSKGKKTKIGVDSDGVTVYKWARERKK